MIHRSASEQGNSLLFDGNIHIFNRPIYSIFVLVISCIILYWVFYWVVRMFFIVLFTPPESIKKIYFEDLGDWSDPEFYRKLVAFGEGWLYQTLTYPYTKNIGEI